MAGQNDRVGLTQIPDQGADLDHLRGVKADGRLVQNDDLGCAQQRGGNADTLAVALGQVADEPLLHPLQTRAGSGMLYRRNAVCLFAGALQLGHKKQILPRGHLRIERRQLRQIADAGLGLCGFLCNIMAVDSHGAVCGGNIAGYDIHRGGLACPVGTQQPVNAAVLDGEADILHRGVAAVALCQMLYLNQSAHSPLSHGFKGIAAVQKLCRDA